MAKATLEGKVTLEMSFQEAETLRSLFEYVSGHPETSRRKYTDAIAFALDAAGVKETVFDLHGVVTFEG